MVADESDLQFIRCPGCRSLVPAVATRCRMCGQLLEPKSRETSESLNKKSRVRQRTMSVSEDERDSLKDQVLAGEFSEPTEPSELDEEYPVEADDYDELPEDVRGFAERGDHSIGEREIDQPDARAKRPTLEESWSFEESVAVLELPDDEDEFEEEGDESVDSEDSPSDSAQPKRKRRRRRKKKTAPAAEPSMDIAAEVSDDVPMTASGKGLAATMLSSEHVSERAAAGQSKEAQPSSATGPRGIGWTNPETPRQGTADPRGDSPTAAPSRDKSDHRSPAGPSRAPAPVTSSNPSRSSPVIDQALPVSSDRTSLASERPPVRAPERPTPSPRAGTPRPENALPIQESPQPGGGELVGWLVFHESGETVSRELRGGQFFVSRERLRPQDVVFDHPSVSMPQCLLFAHEDSGVTVQDLMSEHGTFLRRAGSGEFERQQGQFRVDHGDVVRFGDLEVMLCLLPRG